MRFSHKRRSLNLRVYVSILILVACLRWNQAKADTSHKYLLFGSSIVQQSSSEKMLQVKLRYIIFFIRRWYYDNRLSLHPAFVLEARNMHGSAFRALWSFRYSPLANEFMYCIFYFCCRKWQTDANTYNIKIRKKKILNRHKKLFNAVEAIVFSCNLRN